MPVTWSLLNYIDYPRSFFASNPLYYIMLCNVVLQTANAPATNSIMSTLSNLYAFLSIKNLRSWGKLGTGGNLTF